MLENEYIFYFNLVSGRYEVTVQESQYTAKMEQRTVRDLQCNSCFSWKSILLRWYVVSDLQRNSKRTQLWKKVIRNAFFIQTTWIHLAAKLL